MVVAIIGGTGAEGFGLSKRLAKAGLSVIIGSRQAEKAQLAAKKINEEYGHDVVGTDNETAIKQAHLIMLCVPFGAQKETLLALRPFLDKKIIITLVVPLAKGDPTHYAPPLAGSAVADAQEILGPNSMVVGAFQTISAHEMDSDQPMESDVLITGDDENAKKVAIETIKLIGANCVDMGNSTHAQYVEAITPLLIGLNKRYKKRGIGVKFVGL